MGGEKRLGIAWIAMCLALALHVADEAYHDFLSVFNPTVLAMREQYAWFSVPTLTYEGWLSGLIVICLGLALLTPFFFAGVRWLRAPAAVFAGFMLLNGVGHIAGTIAGRTVASVQFARPMPGFYSSPLLIAASLYLLAQLRRTARRQRPPHPA